MKKGDKSQKVAELQEMLKEVLDVNMEVDGYYGNNTHKMVVKFQQSAGLYTDGIAGEKTMRKLSEACKQLDPKILSDFQNKFVVFVDAGHWGVDDNGYYNKSGKWAFHKGHEFHDEGYYYEGHENRLVAELFCQELVNNGIMPIRTYHPYKDISLGKRTNIVRSWLKRGYYGYLHSFHSDAISSDNTASKLLNTRGFSVYSTRDNNFSDRIAEQHFQHNNDMFGDDWKMRTQKYKDGDSDFEANFQILRETDLKMFQWFGAILEEFGFHTSSKDCKFIIENRLKRAQASLKTALWVREEIQKL